jgi:Secretion system C-terminal sorting domain
MRHKIFFSLAIIFSTFCLHVYSQVCPSITDLNATNVCGIYGDGNGTSNWNWQINDPLNPNYCVNWYARTSPSGFLTRMGSPFVNATSGKLKIIADNYDYTKDKGWELLQRKFGCLSDIGNPYFVLYNRYTGMMRVFVYLPTNTSNYSQLLMTIKSVYDIRPATASAANDIMQAPDKYFNNLAGPSNDEVMVSLNESVGSNQWAVSEFYMMLDNNIAASIYNNASLEVTVYGVTTSTLEAVIDGTSCPSTTSTCNGVAVKDGVFKTKNASAGGSTFNFTANAEKLLKLSKSFTDFLDGLNKTSKKTADALYSDTTVDAKSILQKFGKFALFVYNNTKDSANFTKVIKGLGGITGQAGQVFKFAGAVIGFLQGSDKSASAPAFTNYNLKLNGSITAQVVVQKFVMKIPATSSPASNANNATYYNCPMGVFNLKNTPLLDTLSYNRRALTPASYNPRGGVPKTIKYTAYKLHDDVQVMVNAGAGMSVVTVEGALLAKVVQRVQENPDPTFTVWIDPLENYPQRGFYRYFNHMRADVEANRLEITHYDADNKYHIIQTPYYPLQCMQRASMNLHVPVMKIFLRLRATLKRTDGLGELVYFIKDYELDKQQGDVAAIPVRISLDLDAIPPYSNYTIPPNSGGTPNTGSGDITPNIQDYTVGGGTSNEIWTVPQELRKNHTITTSSASYITISNTQPTIVFRAGASITLNPKFEAIAGSIFLATVDWGYSSLPCNPSPNITNYTNGSNCYNTGIIAQRSAITPLNTEIQENQVNSVFPNPVNDRLIIKTKNKETIKNLQIIDISGRKFNLEYKYLNSGQIEVNLSRFSNGNYSIVIMRENSLITYKIIILK